MGAPKENQFWKFRTKVGRDKLFASPEELWNEACKYFEWVDDNPLIENRPFVTSNGMGQGSSVEFENIEHKRPYTIHALTLYLNCGLSYFRQFKREQGEKTDEVSKGFLSVIGLIEQTIYSQQFEGASSGFFKENIISRNLGLKDNMDMTTGGEKIQHAPVITTMIDGKVIDLKMNKDEPTAESKPE